MERLIQSSSETLRQRSSSGRGRGILATIAAAIAIFLLLAPSGWRPSSDWTSRDSEEVGYTAVVDEFARLGLLHTREVVRNDGQRLLLLELNDETIDAAADQIGDCRDLAQRIPLSPWFVADRSAPCTGLIHRYAELTHLAVDMRKAALWRLEDSTINGIRADAHQLHIAGPRREAWGGVVSYRDQDARRDAAMFGQRTMLLADFGSNRPFFRFTAGRATLMPLSALMENAPLRTGGGLIIQPESQARFNADQISLRRLGRAVVIGVPEDMPVKLLIDGKAFEPGGRSAAGFGNNHYLLLRPDQFLAIEDQSTGRRRTMQLVETPGSISEMSGNGRRIREPTLDDLVRRVERAGVAGDYTSSIEANLHHDLIRMLTRHMQTGVPQGQPPRESARGTALLLDGINGEIAAAASYPAHVDNLAAADQLKPRRLAWLTMNFNFQPLAIGSAAKIPFAAAITQRYPDLLRMTIPTRRTFDRIDGDLVTLPNGEVKWTGNNIGQATRAGVDFTGFITDSNNEYAMTLLSKATLRERGTNAQVGNGLWKSADGWAGNLWRFSCVVPYGLVDRGTDFGWRTVSDTCSPYLWRRSGGTPLGTNQEPLPFANLHLGHVDNDFTNFYISILGGGDFGWSAANLGQAYARILGGRAISPKLDTQRSNDPHVSIEMDPRVWTAIANGMHGVVVQGTAKTLTTAALTDFAASRPGLFFFAKTGTPDVVSGQRMTDGHVLVLAAVRTSTRRAPTRPADICGLKLLVINLQRSASSALDLAADLLRPGGDPRYREWMSRPCATRAQESQR